MTGNLAKGPMSPQGDNKIKYSLYGGIMERKVESLENKLIRLRIEFDEIKNKINANENSGIPKPLLQHICNFKPKILNLHSTNSST
jgi:hypothetical protein